jgi:hypothetical protein
MMDMNKVLSAFNDEEWYELGLNLGKVADAMIGMDQYKDE